MLLQTLRVAKAVRYDLMLTSDGIHYGEFSKHVDDGFIPWSRIRYWNVVRGAISMHLKPDTSASWPSELTIDTYTLANSGGLRSDIERGVQGTLFDAAPSN